MDIKKQIDYWIDNAFKDVESAELLISNGKYLHGLFFCHLIIEKAIKAHVVKYTQDFPPKSHNLIFLAEKASLELTIEMEEFCGQLMKFQLEGRYPESYPHTPDTGQIKILLEETKKLLKWLKEKL